MARRIVTWDEQDAYTPWRKLYCYLQRPGVVKGIKRRTHRRERREGKAEVAERIREVVDYEPASGGHRQWVLRDDDDGPDCG